MSPTAYTSPLIKIDALDVLKRHSDKIDGDISKKVLAAYDGALRGAKLEPIIKACAKEIDDIRSRLEKLGAATEKAGVHSDDVNDADAALFRLRGTLAGLSRQALAQPDPEKPIAITRRGQGRRVSDAIPRAIARATVLGRDWVFVAAVLHLAKRVEGEFPQVYDRVRQAQNRRSATAPDGKKPRRRI